MVRIAIIGGGPGGLMTAYHLINKSQEKLDITIFEATYRLGGKILTKQFDDGSGIYEAGVAELYHLVGVEDPLRELLTNLGFEFIPMGGDTAIFENKVVPNVDALKEIIGEGCWKGVKKLIETGMAIRKPEDFAGAGWPADNKHPWSDKSLHDVISEITDNEQARRYFEVIIKSDLATETSQVNGTYGFDNYLVDEPEYCNIYTIGGGIERMIDALRDYVNPHATIYLNAPVRHIHKKDDGKYKVVSNDAEKLVSEDFDSVLICLPQQWLASIDFGFDLRSTMKDHFSYYHYPAHYLKVAILFETPFWKDYVGDGSYFRLDAFGGCCVYDESSRYPTGSKGSLNWLIAGSNAEALANLEDNLIITRALESLPPEISQHAKDQFIEAHVHRWIGTVNGQPGGLPVEDIKEKHLPDPEKHPKLVMVGDYLFDSTLNGLLDSSDLATTLLLQHLEKLKPEYQRNPSSSRRPKKYPLSNKVKYLLRRAR